MPIADTTLILEGQQDFSGGMDSSLSPALIRDSSVATSVNLTFRGGRPRSRPGYRQVALSPGKNDGLNKFNNNFFQGSSFYTDRRPFYNSSLICVCGGVVIKIDAATSVVDAIYPVLLASDMVVDKTYVIRTLGNTNFIAYGAAGNVAGETFVATGAPAFSSGGGTVYEIYPALNPFEPCYFTQAEKYMLIQDGQNTPLIFDGDDLYISGRGPDGETGKVSGLHTIGPGTIMAYGQGRLFVANADRTEITAGDLVYGGSTVQKEVAYGEGISNVSPATTALNNSGIITRINVTAAGTNYTSIPTVTISAPTSGGVQATATALIDPNLKTVKAIVVTNGGSGYSTATLPTVTISGGGGTSATANITATDIVGFGANVLATSAFINGEISGTSQYAVYTSGSVVGISVVSGGSGYLTPPGVNISAPTTPGGVQALAVAALNLSGAVSSISVTNPGSGYVSPPSVTFTSGAATATAVIDANHNFNPGEVVTISGHSSSAGVNGTWECKTGTAGNKIVIDLSAPAGTRQTGTGGYVTKANAGAQSDLLKFTENTYLSEGGALQVPAFLGKITGMIFLQIQDTSTGQGDLLVFSERGTATFAVSTPRDNWKTTQFQRVLFQEIGATGPNSLVASNGDVFFRSFDGIRSYRNARAEQNSYGQVPVSAEMNSILPYDSKNLLPFVSAIVFDNRLIFTATPTVNYSGLETNIAKRQPVTFSKLIVLDFTTISTIGAKRSASYDGMWGGLNVTQLVSGLIQGKPRAFVFAFDFNNNRVNVLWEISENDVYDYPLGVEPQPIQSILETRSFTFGTPLEQKKLIRSDMWLSDIQGNVDVKVYWRPDQYPCWRPWHTFSRCSVMESCISNGVSVTNKPSGTTEICFSSTTPNNFTYRIGKSSIFSQPLVYSLDPNPAPQAAAMQIALQNAGFNVAFVTRSGTFPNYCFTISTFDLVFWESYTNPISDVWELGGDWVAPFPPGGGGTETELINTYTVIPVKQVGSENCSTNFSVKNLQPQYRPQIRMPTPPEDSDPLISRPYIYGNEFQLRYEFKGHFEMNRILLLGQRILEQYQGTDYLEVL